MEQKQRTTCNDVRQFQNLSVEMCGEDPLTHLPTPIEAFDGYVQIELTGLEPRPLLRLKFLWEEFETYLMECYIPILRCELWDDPDPAYALMENFGCYVQANC